MTIEQSPLVMRECPRYETCSAPICPLDPDWRLRAMLPGERVCIWITELAKPGGEAQIATAIGDEPARFVASLAPEIMAEWGAIRRAADQASRYGSKLEAQRRLGRSSTADKTTSASVPGAQCGE